MKKSNKKYVGSWSANNGSTYNYGYEGSNWRQLAQNMREICRGNIFAGSSGSWQVVDSDDKEVATGTCRKLAV